MQAREMAQRRDVEVPRATALCWAARLLPPTIVRAMGSDERAKDEREQSSVNEGLRLVALAGLLCFALRTYATLPSTTAFRDATQLDERRGVELELFELEQRQRGIDRELRDLGAAVAATEDAWRGAAATAAAAPAAMVGPL